MQDEPTFERSQDELQRDVLYQLTTENEPIWSVDDLGRAINDRIGAVDAVPALIAAGLAHKTTDGFVFATHAGYRAVGVIGAII